MVLLSPRIAAKSVRWKEPVVGRALKVRFDWQGVRVTVIAVYQHVWSPAKTVHQNRQDRASLLKALGRCTRRVPHRDLGRRLQQFARHSAETGRHPVSLARMSQSSATSLGQHRLVALNTWQPLSPHTFVQGKACTQIDFILAREISAGRQAKQASPVLDFALGSWKKEGHRPVLASVTPVRHWNLPGPQVKPLQHDSAALQEAIPANSPQAQRMLEWVTEHLDLDSGPRPGMSS